MNLVYLLDPAIRSSLLSHKAVNAQVRSPQCHLDGSNDQIRLKSCGYVSSGLPFKMFTMDYVSAPDAWRRRGWLLVDRKCQEVPGSRAGLSKAAGQVYIHHEPQITRRLRNFTLVSKPCGNSSVHRGRSHFVY